MSTTKHDVALTDFLKMLYKALNGNKTLHNNMKGIYSAVPEEARAPYISISEIKSHHLSENVVHCSANVTIVTADETMRSCCDYLKEIEKSVASFSNLSGNFHFLAPNIENHTIERSTDVNKTFNYWLGQTSVQCEAIKYQIL